MFFCCEARPHVIAERPHSGAVQESSQGLAARTGLRPRTRMLRMTRGPFAPLHPHWTPLNKKQHMLSTGVHGGRLPPENRSSRCRNCRGSPEQPPGGVGGASAGGGATGVAVGIPARVVADVVGLRQAAPGLMGGVMGGSKWATAWDGGRMCIGKGAPDAHLRPHRRPSGRPQLTSRRGGHAEWPEWQQFRFQAPPSVFGHMSWALSDDPMCRVTFVPSCWAPLFRAENRAGSPRMNRSATRSFGRGSWGGGPLHLGTSGCGGRAVMQAALETFLAGQAVRSRVGAAQRQPAAAPRNARGTRDCVFYACVRLGHGWGDRWRAHAAGARKG